MRFCRYEWLVPRLVVAAALLVGCSGDKDGDPTPPVDSTMGPTTTADTAVTTAPPCPSQVLDAPGTYTANVQGATDDHTASCGGPGGGPEVTFEFTPPRDGNYRFDTRGSSFDTVLTVLDGCEGAELACNDDAWLGRGSDHSDVALSLLADQSYVVVVDVATAATEIGDGAVTLQIREAIAETCDDGIDNDLDDLVDCSDRDCRSDGACCPNKATIGPGTWVTSTRGLPNLFDAEGDSSGGDVSFGFTADQTGAYTFDVSSSPVPHDLLILEDCGGDRLGAAHEGEVTISMVAGQSAVVVVDAPRADAEGAARLDVVTIGTERCGDGVDNDRDGRLDCFDVADCAGDPICGPEVCDDGVDNDTDWRVDCVDDDCATAPQCCSNLVLPGTGSYDLDTTDYPPGPPSPCQSLVVPAGLRAAFTPSSTGTYRFKVDRNMTLSLQRGCGGDVLACFYDPLSPSDRVEIQRRLRAGETYVLQIDGPEGSGNLDGRVTLDVTQVADEDCSDGIDNNLDGQVDCRDRQCATHPACLEDCDNGIDDDSDGALDCLDAACATAASCCPSIRVSTVPFVVSGNFSDHDDHQRPLCTDFNDGSSQNDLTIEFVPPSDGVYRLRGTGNFWGAVKTACNGVERSCRSGGTGAFEGTAGEPLILVVEAFDSTEDYRFVINRVSSGPLCPTALSECFEIDCTDGEDEDLDGDVDCRDSDCVVDPACTEDCGNGLDDDLDGRTDCRDDYCALSSQCAETCDNALDDDGDGQTDCDDRGCGGTSPCCPRGGTVNTVPAQILFDLDEESDLHDTSCWSEAYDGGNDYTVEFVAPADDWYAFTTASDVLELRDSCLGIALDCEPYWPIVRWLAAGEAVTVVVENGFWAGPSSIDIAPWSPTESDCANGIDDDLDLRLDCRDPDCASDPACVEADCDDGVDNDYDFDVDCDDRDCWGGVPCIEADCYDGLDNDGDSTADCADPDCDLEAHCVEDCVNGVDDDGDLAIDCDDGACAADEACCPADRADDVPFVAMDQFAYYADTFAPSCGDSLGGGRHSDYVVEFRAPAAGDYLFATNDVSGGQTLALFDGCGGEELACAEPETGIVRTMAAGERVVVVLEGERFDALPFELQILPATPLEVQCDNGVDEDRDGPTDCDDIDCGTHPSCVELDCADGTDDDADGAIDCLDADCHVDPDCAETCDDAQDNDGDSLFDCDDPGCAADLACCVTGSPLTTTDVADTRLELDKNTPSCALSFAPDATFEFTAPADGDYSFDTFGSEIDTVLTVLDGCGGAELACNDDALGLQSQVTVDLTAGQTVLVVVDGFADSAGQVDVRVQ